MNQSEQKTHLKPACSCSPILVISFFKLHSQKPLCNPLPISLNPLLPSRLTPFLSFPSKLSNQNPSLLLSPSNLPFKLSLYHCYPLLPSYSRLFFQKKDELSSHFFPLTPLGSPSLPKATKQKLLSPPDFLPTF